MPAINTRRFFQPGGCYHIYHRGANRSVVFREGKDFGFFKRAAKQTAEKMPGLTIWTGVCLPNHFHLLVQQKESRDISKFMAILLIRYVKFFNKKYQHTGPLFEGKYRAVLLPNDAAKERVQKYIEDNAFSAGLIRRHRW